MLRSFAELEKKLVLAGQGNKIEVWAEDLWHGGMSNWLTDESLDELDIGEELKDLSI